MPEFRPAFLFFLAQPEAKRWLCDELERLCPGLRLAYSRPGLYSFKLSDTESLPNRPIWPIFARHCGFSLGFARGVHELGPLLASLERPLRLHVFARDAGEAKPLASHGTIDTCRQAILETGAGIFHTDPRPHAGDWVLDVILPPDDNTDESWFVGCHRHDAKRSPEPGSVTRQLPPPFAPSRAWSKIEELLRWSQLPFAAGDVAVEIGCAPGGAVVAMLDRGMRVTGIDPAAIDPRVAAHESAILGNFHHIALPVGSLRREQLPKRVDWLLCDANLAPQVAIRALAYWSKQLRPQLRGILFTLKINDQRAYDAIPRIIAQVAELGLGEPRAVQLPSHRSEIAVFAARHRA